LTIYSGAAFDKVFCTKVCTLQQNMLVTINPYQIMELWIWLILLAINRSYQSSLKFEPGEHDGVGGGILTKAQM